MVFRRERAGIKSIILLSPALSGLLSGDWRLKMRELLSDLFLLCHGFSDAPIQSKVKKISPYMHSISSTFKTYKNI